MSLKLAYGIGQFVNGQLAEQLRPRRLLAFGLLGTGLLNILFGWATSLYFLTFVWACNGYIQSLGWPPTMRIAANWFPVEQRGRAIGIIGTGYQLCGALVFVVAGWAADKFGWRGALYIPAFIVTASAIHMMFFLKDSPPEETERTSTKHRSGIDFSAAWKNICLTLSNPGLWLVAVALCLLDACRYGFTDWGVTHLKEVHHDSVETAAFKFAVLPFGGICGTLFAGWVTDKFFKGRPAPVICVLLFALGFAALVYDHVIHWGIAASTLSLFIVGFCIYGPQVLLVGTLPIDLARGRTAAAAAGFVNFMGAIGSAAGDKITGHLAQDYGWQFAVRFWSACGFVAAIVVACLWNVGKTKSVAND